MTQENVEIVRGYFEAAASGGIRFDVLDDEALDRAIQGFHPEVEFHEDLKFPEATVYRGRDALRAYFRQFSGEFDRFWFEAEDILDAGDDQVLLLTHVHGRGKGSGADFDMRGAWLLTMGEETAVRVDGYLDRREALEAAGLRE